MANRLKVKKHKGSKDTDIEELKKEIENWKREISHSRMKMKISRRSKPQRIQIIKSRHMAGN